MSSVRVEAILDAISQLSPEEQLELAHDLPQVLRTGSHNGYLSAEAVRHAIQVRERLRQRLAAAGQPPGSIDEDLDAIRDGRLDDLLGDSDQAQDQRS
jgi:hypothetical protein